MNSDDKKRMKRGKKVESVPKAEEKKTETKTTKPAAKKILETIASRDFDETKVKGCATVLAEIEGPVFADAN